MQAQGFFEWVGVLPKYFRNTKEFLKVNDTCWIIKVMFPLILNFLTLEFKLSRILKNFPECSNELKLLQCYHIKTVIYQQCPHPHHEGTSVFLFSVTGPLSCLIIANIKPGWFSIVWNKISFTFFIFMCSINAPVKRVWFILIKYWILLDFKHFRWNLYAAKMLLLTLKTITLKYILNRKGLV